MDRDQKAEGRRWYKARQLELRELIWEWDPVGLMGAPDDEYDCLIDPLLGELSRGNTDPPAVAGVLSGELVHMGESGFSGRLVGQEGRDDRLDPVVQRILAWRSAAPPRP